ncbi:MAG: GGDEF domain-containing protein [Gammaproteobacteria bacterium]|nr:GGDEF domain-containing protein [Gammaproteobacteria bacterium]
MAKETDWKQKYKAAVNELDKNETESGETISILRKAVGRLSIAARGHDDCLNVQLKKIQEYSRKKQDQKIDVALEQLAEIVVTLDNVVEPANQGPVDEKIEPPGMKSDASDQFADSMIGSLIDRLSRLRGVGTEKNLAGIPQPVSKDNWESAVDGIVASISELIDALNDEKIDLEQFIAGITKQLDQIVSVVGAELGDLQSNQQDTRKLNELVNEGVSIIGASVASTEDIDQLKLAISQNISLIRDGVGEFVSQINQRYEAAAMRNKNLSQQLQQMDQQTQSLQQKLSDNKRQLLYDALTGVRSRIAYDEHIQQEMDRWQRYKNPFSYVIFDIDHFKKINDTHGHNAGDKALKIIAGMIQKNIRKSDLVYRIGGEEFVVLLPNTDSARADSLVDKVRNAIAGSGIHFKQQMVQITLSAGITESRDGDTIEKIYERADRALYRAKNAGRNCQFIAES